MRGRGTWPGSSEGLQGWREAAWGSGWVCSVGIIWGEVCVRACMCVCVCVCVCTYVYVYD